MPSVSPSKLLEMARWSIESYFSDIDYDVPSDSRFNRLPLFISVYNLTTLIGFQGDMDTKNRQTFNKIFYCSRTAALSNKDNYITGNDLSSMVVKLHLVKNIETYSRNRYSDLSHIITPNIHGITLSYPTRKHPHYSDVIPLMWDTYRTLEEMMTYLRVKAKMDANFRWTRDDRVTVQTFRVDTYSE